MMTKEATEDFSVQDCGSMCLFTAHTRSCREWVHENLGLEGWQWMGSSSFSVDHRYAQDIEKVLLEEGWVKNEDH